MTIVRFLLYQTNMLSYIWRIWCVGQGISLAPQWSIYNGMLWHILPFPKKCPAPLFFGFLLHMTVLRFWITYWLIFQQYFVAPCVNLFSFCFAAFIKYSSSERIWMVTANAIVVGPAPGSYLCYLVITHPPASFYLSVFQEVKAVIKISK